MAKSKTYNKNPLLAREGKIYLNGSEVAECTKFQVVFTPSVWEGKTLGEHGTNRRWTGYDITGTIEGWRTNNRWKAMIQKYIKDGITPEFKMQGINEDKGSDYYAKNGTDKITVVGCVLTGDINLMDLDTDGDVVKDSIKYGAKDLA